MTRWMHPPRRDRTADADRFDPIELGARHGLDADAARALWDRACAETTGHDAARARFLVLARAPRLAIGRVTRVGIELADEPDPRIARGDRAPGRVTRLSAAPRSAAPISDTVPAARALAPVDAGLDVSDPWLRALLGRGSAGVPGAALGVLAGPHVPGAMRIARQAEAEPMVDAAAVWPVLREARGAAPLPAALAAELTAQLGVDLSRVRVHTDDLAARLAAALGARAFTAGEDIFFARGAYDPTTTAGRALIAHEVMHVAQHARGAISDSERVISAPDDPHERQADAFARRFAPAPVTAPGTATNAGDAAFGAEPPAQAALATRAAGREPRIDRAPAAGASYDDAMWRQVFHGASVPVGKLARVSAAKGIRLHAGPTPASPRSGPIIAFNALVHVERTTSGADLAKRWAYVVTVNGSAGFIEEKFLAIDPPEPDATLYVVAPRDKLGAIAERRFGAQITGGNDARLYVQAIYEANKGRPGIRLQPVTLSWRQTWNRREAEEQTLEVYKGVAILAGHAIWIPSEGFVQQLKASGAITSGSTEFAKAARVAKDVGTAVVHGVEFLAGAVVGILEGAWQALVDIFKGAWELVKMAFEIFKAYLTGTMLQLGLDTVNKLKSFFEKLDAGQLVKALGAYIAHRWTDATWYGRGEFVGQVIGYIALNVLLIMATAGGSIGTLLARSAAAGSDIARVVMALVKVVDVAQNPLKLLEGAGKGLAVSEEVAAKLKQALPREVAKDANKAKKVVKGGEHAAEDAGRDAVKGGAKAKQPPKDGCFVAGTLVATREGPRAIEALTCGVHVRAARPEDGVRGEPSVTRTFRHEVPTVLDLRIENITVTCSPPHPFWVARRGWTAAGELRLGDQLVTARGTFVAVAGIAERHGLHVVHNISVDELATYHVSPLEVLVHNKPMKYDPRAMFETRRAGLHESIAEVRGRIKKAKTLAKTDVDKAAIKKLENDVDNLERQVKSTKYTAPVEGVDPAHAYDPLAALEKAETKALKDVEALEKAVTPKRVIPASRSALDSETVLADASKYKPTSKHFQGREIYSGADGKYYYVDNFHKGARSEIEVFNSVGEHLGTMTIDGVFDAAGKKAGRKLTKNLL